jgi:riboflavin biosynthesis pyrimidine reductase
MLTRSGGSKPTPLHDISVDGPELAAQAMGAGLVDEFQMIVCPAVVGGGSDSS